MELKARTNGDGDPARTINFNVDGDNFTSLEKKFSYQRETEKKRQKKEKKEREREKGRKK